MVLGAVGYIHYTTTASGLPILRFRGENGGATTAIAVVE